MTERSTEQHLIDLTFEIAMVSAQSLAAFQDDGVYNRERHMAWVADQLRKCGYDTKPMGCSWGVLKK